MGAPQAPWQPVASPGDVPVGPHTAGATVELARWRVLDRYDGFALLGLAALGEETCLWSWHDTNRAPAQDRYLVARITDAQAVRVSADVNTDVDVLFQPRDGQLYLVDLDVTVLPQTVVRAWCCPIGDVPAEYLSREMR